FWMAPTMTDAMALIAGADKEAIYLSLAQTAVAATERTQKKLTLSDGADLSAVLTRVLRQELNRLTAKLENGLTLLASIGSTAPFVGLLGTVWGIYHALTAISSSGAVQLEQLAGPVGEALIMTALGLLVAIPAVLAYNGLNRINRITLAELDGFAHDLHVHLSKQSLPESDNGVR
ncbi:MAG: MotA/TolQ/ExbB proton channel family protein, partial [Burkholderiales bacterium]|nr:MotA/TolQ/ExbB proton channel family protein [Burkholderiales bacterium]